MRKSIIWFSLLLVAFVISTCFNITPASAQAVDPPKGIHLTWQSDDTAHTITITWENRGENAGDVVRYGVNPGEYGSSVVGSHHTYSGARGYVHDVELTGLSPNTVYFFICGGENGGWSDERSFRTAPDNTLAFTFVAGGDSRSGSGDWPVPRDAVSRVMAKFNPSFVLYVGDFVMQGNYQGEWDNWFAAEQMYWVDNNNLTIPIIPCIGNHEIYGDSGVSYLGQFSLPGNEKWYSFDWGPNLHITVLDTETDMGGAQRDWLQEDLATHENYLWKVVLFHRPPFSDGSDGSNLSVRQYWVPLFDEYHVDLVISGHNHLYERTYPINYTVSENTPMPSTENATIYVVSGGWGAPLYTDTPSWWAAVGPISKNSFTVVDLYENGLLRLRAIDTDGNVLDNLSIQKTVPEVVVEGISPLVIGVVAVVIVCAGVVFYLLKVRRKS